MKYLSGHISRESIILMHPKLKTPFLALALLALLSGMAFAAANTIFEGEVNADNINVRSDATVTSSVICVVNKGTVVEAVSKSYDWYKMRLPKSAPSFIKKDFLSMLDDKTAKVTASSVNIRLSPSDSSAVLGKAKENEVVSVLDAAGAWVRIEPINNSFGWIHSRFVKPAEKEKGTAGAAQKTKETENAAKEPSGKDEIIAQGLIKNKTITRIATHKLLATDGRIFLLKGNKESLNALDNKKAKVWGKLKNLPNQEYPLIEITKIEAED